MVEIETGLQLTTGRRLHEAPFIKSEFFFSEFNGNLLGDEESISDSHDNIMGMIGVIVWWEFWFMILIPYHCYGEF